MKQAVPLLSSCSICALLFCLCLLLLPAPQQSISPRTTPHPLLQCPAQQLDKIIFEDFCLLNTGSHFVLKDYEELPLQESRTTALLQLLSHCSGEAAPIPSAAPLRQLSLVQVDGQQQDLSLYDMGSGCILSDGQRAIALPRETIQPLLWQAEEFVDPQLFSLALPREGDFLLSGRLHKEPLHFSYYIEEEKLQAVLTEPVQKEISEEVFLPFLTSLKQLDSLQILSLAPDAAQLRACGLDTPFCLLQGNLQGDAFCLSLSQPTDRNTVYLMMEGIPLLCEASAEQLPWLGYCKESLSEEIIFSPDYEDSTVFRLSTPHSQYSFSKWAGQVLCRGRQIDERMFHKLFRLSTNLIPEAAAACPTGEEIVLQINISYTNPTKSGEELIFYYYNEDFLLLSLNGDKRFLFPQELGRDILQLCQSLLQ